MHALAQHTTPNPRRHHSTGNAQGAHRRVPGNTTPSEAAPGAAHAQAAVLSGQGSPHPPPGVPGLLPVSKEENPAKDGKPVKDEKNGPEPRLLGPRGPRRLPKKSSNGSSRTKKTPFMKPSFSFVCLAGKPQRGETGGRLVPFPHREGGHGAAGAPRRPVPAAAVRTVRPAPRGRAQGCSAQPAALAGAIRK